MKNLNEFKNLGIKFVFTDIDDTLTDHGQLGPEAYAALWELKRRGLHIVPITGRPAGWCEMIARFWPVDGIVGENGGFYFRYINKEMKRKFFFDDETQKKNRAKLDVLSKKILKEVPGCAIASDQFSRLMDLAVDFCEDVEPLPRDQVQKIVSLFEEAGALAKVSSIHVNGWFGNYDKLSMCRTFLMEEFKLDIDNVNDSCIFVGDSPNDEPMFGFFNNSFAVANIKNFVNDLKQKPKFIANLEGGHGFVEIAKRLL